METRSRGTKENVVQALLQQRRANTPTSSEARAFDKHERVKQLLQQRRSLNPSTGYSTFDNLGSEYSVAATIGPELAGALLQQPTHSGDDLLSPSSSTSFEFDHEQTSVQREGRSAEATHMVSGASTAGSPAANKHSRLAAIEEETASFTHLPQSPPVQRATGSAMSMLGQRFQAQKQDLHIAQNQQGMGNADAPTSATGGREPRSLAEIEQMLQEAMGAFSLERDPTALGSHSGPFDISEMWSAGGSVQSPNQSFGQSDSQNRSNNGAHAGYGEPEVSSMQRPRSAAAPSKQTAAQSVARGRVLHTQRPVSGKPAAAPSAAAAGNKQPPVRPRPASAPRMRAPSPSGSVPTASITQKQPFIGTRGEFSFKPKINQSSREMVRMRYPSDREERILQLSVPKPVLMQKYESVRKEVEESELKECTFAPRTGRPPSPARVNPTVPAHERLYNQTPNHQRKRELLVKEREEAELAHCTFKPHINERRAASASRQRPASTGRVPLHMRVADVLRTKNENLSNACVRMELADEGLTFKPSINRKSVQLVMKKQAQEGVHTENAAERLYKRHEEKLRSRQADTTRDQEYTFTPVVNPKSQKLMARSQELPAGFLERQQYLAALAAEKKELYRSLVEEAECRGQPQMRASTSGPMDKGSWSSDYSEDRLTKLAYQDVRQSRALKDALTEHHYSQYTFTPTLNPKSRVIGRQHTIEELYRNDQGQMRKERAKMAVNDHVDEQCTFQPALNPVSLSLAQRVRKSGGGLLDAFDAEHIVKARAAKLQDARAVREYEELRECTFTPEINRSVPDFGKGPKEVPGAARFMELREMARKKAEDEKRRQEEVWWQRPRGNDSLYTVPAPFSFEERELAIRASKLAEDEAAAHAASQAAARQAAVRRSGQQAQQRSLQRILQQMESTRR